MQGDQASIVAGAINFVKELEQLLQSLEAQKRRQGGCTEPPPPPAPFAGFFTFPQYSTAATGVVGSSDSAGSGGDQSGAAARERERGGAWPTSRWPWRRATPT